MKRAENKMFDNKFQENKNVPKKTHPHKSVIFLFIVLAILLVISVSVIISQRRYTNQLKSNVEYYKERLKEKDDTISNLKNDVRSMKNNGQKYHKHTCQYIVGKNYYIYNIAAAEHYGYEPCDICFNNNEDDHIKTKFEEDLDRIKEKVSS